MRGLFEFVVAMGFIAAICVIAGGCIWVAYSVVVLLDLSWWPRHLAGLLAVVVAAFGTYYISRWLHGVMEQFVNRGHFQRRGGISGDADVTAGRPDEPDDRAALGGGGNRKEPVPPITNPQRHSNAFQTKEEADEFREQLSQELLANLARNVLAEAKELEPGADWSAWTLGERIFRVSPDRKEARELQPDGFWRIVMADYVLAHARPGPAVTRAVNQFKPVSMDEMDRALAVATQTKAWRVEVYDNFESPDDRYCTTVGHFDTLAEAIACAQGIVDKSLDYLRKPEMSAEDWYGHYSSFGDGTYIVGEKPSGFNPYFYAKERIESLTRERPEAPSDGIQQELPLS